MKKIFCRNKVKFEKRKYPENIEKKKFFKMFIFEKHNIDVLLRSN